MKEHEIRQVIAEVCQRLDDRAVQLRAASRRAIPALVGASIGFVGACGGEATDGGPTFEYGAPPADAGDAKSDQDSGSGDVGPTVEYGGPPMDAADEDAGVTPPYMGAFSDKDP